VPPSRMVRLQSACFELGSIAGRLSQRPDVPPRRPFKGVQNGPIGDLPRTDFIDFQGGRKSVSDELWGSRDSREKPSGLPELNAEV